ncbi:MAG: hypothetical protein HOE90_19075 [Bacteriovoracaceae bacterium]|jgi:uncharacterized protein YjiK|nr:hypothetical protein [Bacteriovoracaceae bacterium]
MKSTNLLLILSIFIFVSCNPEPSEPVPEPRVGESLLYENGDGSLNENSLYQRDPEQVYELQNLNDEDFEDFSAISFIPEKNIYIAVRNDNNLHFLDSDFQTISDLEFVGFSSTTRQNDFEGVVYLGMVGTQMEFALSNEIGQVYIGKIATTDTEANRENFQKIVVASSLSIPLNKGPEGITYDHATSTFYIAFEGKGDKNTFVVSFVRPESSKDGIKVDTEVPFNVVEVTGAEDLADIFFDSQTGNLILLSEQSSYLYEINPSGALVGKHPLNLSRQHESLFINGKRELLVGAEPNFIDFFPLK